MPRPVYHVPRYIESMKGNEMAEGKEALLRAVDDCRQEMTEALQRWVRIATVNPPGERYEEFIAAFDEWLTGLGYQTEIHRVPEERLDELAPFGNRSPRPNLVARLSGPSGEGMRVHLNGHYDVVPAANDWTQDPWGGELIDGKIFGRGSSDMKGGLVAQVFAVEALRRAGIEWAGTITHSIVADEETVGNMNAGTGFLVEQGVISAGNTDAVIITEPFGLDGIGVGHKGAIWGEFTFKGKQSHGSTPHLGVNAVELLARFLARVETELQPELASTRGDRRASDATGSCSVNNVLRYDLRRCGDQRGAGPLLGDVQPALRNVGNAGGRARRDALDPRRDAGRRSAHRL
jgi:succinyl-diaminopimelate desuccinylase